MRSITPSATFPPTTPPLEEHVRRLLEVLEAYEEARPAIRDEALARRLEQLGERVELAFVKEDVAVLLRESREGIGRVRKIVQDLKNFSRVDAEDDWQWTDLHQGSSRPSISSPAN